MSDETPAATARRLMRQSGRATLATRLSDGDTAWPYASLVLVACDQDISPLLFISDLAVHTKNLTADPHASILFDGTADLANPLTGARVTLLCRGEPVDDDRLRNRFVRRQPSAEGYRTFGDFRLWRFAPVRGQLVAGFGKINWIEADALRPQPAVAAALTDAEADILLEFNAKHADLINTLGRRTADQSGWRLTGVDADGADLRAEDYTARLDFAGPAGDAGAILQELQRLAAA
ncbi:MAG TPA: pyridoxamine 5'-phosphate oxidase family protein [Caulobacteraceae bacterium]|nr:pyridoxamine 5'-phosphate oxidase family protein [Caulobacteraceae bacterium]